MLRQGAANLFCAVWKKVCTTHRHQLPICCFSRPFDRASRWNASPFSSARSSIYCIEFSMRCRSTSVSVINTALPLASKNASAGVRVKAKFSNRVAGVVRRQSGATTGVESSAASGIFGDTWCQYPFRPHSRKLQDHRSRDKGRQTARKGTDPF